MIALVVHHRNTHDKLLCVREGNQVLEHISQLTYANTKVCPRKKNNKSSQSFLMTERPDMSALSMRNDSWQDNTKQRWLQACGTRPQLARWRNMRTKDKYRLLHSVAMTADDDVTSDGDYVTAYEMIDIDELAEGKRQWSVEHVVPRSHVRGDGPAESDPVGWIEATINANSRRSNHPLVLWPDSDDEVALPNTLVRFDGVMHFVPPAVQRGRLARKWLFIRATYDEIDPPTIAQQCRAKQIVTLAQCQRVWPAEERVNQWYRKNLGWANPLLEQGSDAWYSSEDWLELIFV